MSRARRRSWAQRQARGALVFALAAGWLLGLACSSPDLSGTRFSCATDADCAPGQVCAAFHGVLACQFPGASLGTECRGGACPATTAGGMGGSAAPLDAGASPGACSGPSCGVSPAALGSEGPSAEAPLVSGPLTQPSGGAANPASGGAVDPEPGGAAADAGPSEIPSPGGALDAGASAAAPPPSVRFDFETGLEGWQSVLNQRPADVLDGTEQSTALAHHGTGALRMVFDGNFTPLPPAPPGAPAFGPPSFFGVFEMGAPPPGVDVSLWMFSTAPGVSAEVYAQSGTGFTSTVLATVPLPQSQWRQITVTMPLAAALQFGVRLDAPFGIQGFVYLDEISW